MRELRAVAEILDIRKKTQNLPFFFLRQKSILLTHGPSSNIYLPVLLAKNFTPGEEEKYQTISTTPKIIIRKKVQRKVFFSANFVLFVTGQF